MKNRDPAGFSVQDAASTAPRAATTAVTPSTTGSGADRLASREPRPTQAQMISPARDWCRNRARTGSLRA